MIQSWFKLSIILPCYNEERYLYSTVTNIEREMSRDFWEDFPYEILIVNDGSKDGTEAVARQIEQEQPKVRLITYPNNRGKWHAIKTGVADAQGEIICYMDSDGDVDPKYTRTYYEYLSENPEIHIAIASKAIEESTVKRPMKRILLSWVSQTINRLLFSLPIRDTQVGMKMFRANVGKEIFPIVTIEWYAFDVEFLFHANMRHYNIKELPITLDLKHKKSNIDFYDTVRILADLFILFKKINYIYILRKHELKFKTRLRIYMLRVIVFPTERVLSFFLRIFKSKKKRPVELEIKN